MVIGGSRLGIHVFLIITYLCALATADDHNHKHHDFLNGPFSLLDSDNWSIPEDLSVRLMDLKAPLVPVMLMGVSRSGKSLLLNLFSRYLIENKLASSPVESKFFEPHSIHSFPFGVSSAMTRCSVGINAVILKRHVPGVSDDDSGYYILMDAEGSDNGNRKIVSKILGIARHLTNTLIFVDDNRFDRALDALGRLVAYGLKSSHAVSSSNQEGATVVSKGQSWPRLVMVLNKVLETLPEDDSAFFREQIRSKEDDDDATNGLRTLVSDLFADMEFITVPHNQTLKRLVEEQGASSLASLDLLHMKGAGAATFGAKFKTFAEHLVQTASPLVLHRQLTAGVGAVQQLTGAPAQLLVNGKLFSVHLESLLVKSRSIFFPDSNYLQQIVGVTCNEIKRAALQDYARMLEEKGLVPGPAGLGRFNHSSQLVVLHEETTAALRKKLEADIAEYHGGCGEQQAALEEHFARHIAGLVSVLQPVASREESRHTLVGRRSEESIGGVVNQPNAYFSGTDSSGSSIAETLFAQSLDRLLPSTHCNTSVTVLEYSTMRVQVRDVTILGNGVELPQPWRPQEEPAVVITSKRYAYVHLTAQWAFLRLGLCAAGWYCFAKLWGLAGGCATLLVQFIPAGVLPELRASLLSELPAAKPVLEAAEAAFGVLAVQARSAYVRLELVQSAPFLVLLLLALAGHDSLHGKYRKYLAYSEMQLQLLERGHGRQCAGFAPTPTQLYAAAVAAGPEVLAAVTEKLSLLQSVGLAGPAATEAMLQLSFYAAAGGLAVLAISAVAMLGTCTIGQLLIDAWAFANTPKQSAPVPVVAESAAESPTPVGPVVAPSSISKVRSPVASVSLRMGGLYVSPPALAARGSAEKRVKDPEEAVLSSPGASSPTEPASGGSDVSLHSVDSNGSPVPLHQLLLQIQQHSVKKSEKKSEPQKEVASAQTTATVPAVRQQAASINRRRSTGGLGDSILGASNSFARRQAPVAAPVARAGRESIGSPFLANIINQSRSSGLGASPSPAGSVLFDSPTMGGVSSLGAGSQSHRRSSNGESGVLAESNVNVPRQSLGEGKGSKSNKQNTTKMLRNLLGEL